MSLDADDLLMFARVAEAGSFVKAADTLRLPKSTLSRRLAALESRLGERLMQRTTRKLVLTEFGRRILEHARLVAAEVDEARAVALYRQARPSGPLRVSMPADLAAMALAPMLARYAADHPDVLLDIDLSPRRVDLIDESIDVAIRLGALPDDSRLVARRVALFTVGLYATPDYLRTAGEPQLPAALANIHALMLTSRAPGLPAWTLERGQGAAAERWQGTPPRRSVANSPDLLMRMALAGAGIAQVSDFFAQPHVAAGRLVRVLPAWRLPPDPAHAVFPGRRLLPAKTRGFIDAVAQALQACRG